MTATTKANTRRRFAKGLKAAELLSIIISYKTTNDGASPSVGVWGAVGALRLERLVEDWEGR